MTSTKKVKATWPLRSMPSSSSELRKDQAKRRFTITGVLLDGDGMGMDFSLKDFCQNIHRTSQLAEDAIVQELVGKRV